jgi:hypothetical protein
MRLKFRSPSERLKVIQDTIPEGKFIAFFGTSHTSGSCVRDGMGEQIDLSRIWAQQVADHMGLPLFNASNPGIDNDIMIQMMLDFLEKYVLRKEHFDWAEICSMVLLNTDEKNLFHN